MSDLQSMKPRDFLSTWLAVVFKPGQFFAEPESERTSWSPIKFALTIGTISLSASVSYQAWAKTGSGSKTAIAALVAAVVAPLITFVSLYIEAGLVHLALGLV